LKIKVSSKKKIRERSQYGFSFEQKVGIYMTLNIKKITTIIPLEFLHWKDALKEAPYLA
jgi:hypothetical protein